MSVPLPERVGGLRFLRAVVLTVCLGTALNSAGIYLTWRDNNESNTALCALRGDLERRVAASEQFLKDHPNGVAGIPAKTIRDGIENQKRTISALSVLSCT